MWNWYKNRHKDQRNRTESPEPNGQLISNKGDENIKWEKVSSASGAGETGQLHVDPRNQTRPHTRHKNQLKMA